MTRFKRTLPRARYEVRQLTHTLHLPPAQSELYDGPHPAWLRDVLEQLPHLQSLVVSQLPFFDHGALLALRQPSRARQQRHGADGGSPEKYVPTYPLRLLGATACGNTTSAGLATALPLWPGLVFLDLSGTLAARDAAVLASLRVMPGLQVLKLRAIQLRDVDVEVLAAAVGIRVRSLDVRDNRLTDASVRTLLEKCCHPTRDVHAAQSRLAMERSAVDEDWPTGCPRPDPHVLSQFRGDDMDARFVRRLTRAVVGRIPTEDLPPPGLTHLYISDNYITVEALARLLRTENLHVLDAGAADTARAIGRKRSSTVSVTHFELESLPRAENLVPALETAASRNLTYLRLHHSVVTEAALSKDDLPISAVELDGEDVRPELESSEAQRYEAEGDTALTLEIGDSVPVYELSADPASPHSERASDPLQIVVSPAVDHAPPPPFDSFKPLEVNRDPALAPEVADDPPDIEEPVVLTPTGLGNIAQAVNGVPSNDEGLPTPVIKAPTGGSGSPLSALAPKDAAVARSEAARETIGKLEAQRREVRHGVRDHSRGLLPGLVPGMRTLVLVEVPTYTTNPHVVANLRAFITDCAREAYLATTQAWLESQPFEHAPNISHLQRTRTSLYTERARALFALQRIVLEMAPVSSATASTIDGPTASRPPAATSPRSPHSPFPPFHTAAPSHASYPRGYSSAWRSPVRQQQKNYSSTEDPDTEAFWQAQEHDFSFFGDEECGLPASDARVPLSALTEKVALATDGDDDGGALGTAPAPTQPVQQQDSSSRPRSLSTLSLSPVTSANTLRPETAGDGREEPRTLDVVAELARWRADRKAVWERVAKDGGFVEGYWPGEVRVVRPPPPSLKAMGNGGVDCYGNYFEKGVYR